jgi:cobalt/nickel transport system permease protein
MHHAYIDKFAYQDSPIHRLDSRVKFLVTFLFTAVVIALPKASLSILFCYAIGPFTVLVIGGIPLRFVFKHILIVSPFVLVLALSCVIYDKTAITVAFGPFSWHSTLGLVRCCVIVGKFIVTMMALIALVSTTRFSDLLTGLQKLYVPKVLIIQLGFLYRYIFILIDRAHHILRARQIRRLRNLGVKKELKVAASMVGSLLVGSLETAENVNIAMHARGFSGNWHSLTGKNTGIGEFVFGFIALAFTIGLLFFIEPVLR